MSEEIIQDVFHSVLRTVRLRQGFTTLKQKTDEKIAAKQKSSDPNRGSACKEEVD